MIVGFLSLLSIISEPIGLLGLPNYGILDETVNELFDNLGKEKISFLIERNHTCRLRE